MFVASSAAIAEDRACGAFVCSLSGFKAEDCDKVLKRMLDRAFSWKPKSAIPSWGSCTKESEEHDDEIESKGYEVPKQEDKYGTIDYGASLIYAKKWDIAGQNWLEEPDWAITPRIIDGPQNRCEDLKAAQLEPESKGAPPWFCVASLSQVATTKNGVQYGDTMYFNNDRNPFRYDRSDYSRDIETGEISRGKGSAETYQADILQPIPETEGDTDEEWTPITQQAEQTPNTGDSEPDSDILYNSPDGDIREQVGDLRPDGVSDEEWNSMIKQAVGTQTESLRPEGVTDEGWTAITQQAERTPDIQADTQQQIADIEALKLELDRNDPSYSASLQQYQQLIDQLIIFAQ